MTISNSPGDKDKQNEPSAAKEQQPMDKAPGEEVGKAEQVTNEDLKGKKVDRRAGEEQDEPISE